MENVVFWDMASYSFVRSDVSVELVASIYRVERICERKTALDSGLLSHIPQDGIIQQKPHLT
jgi:hypothetical protein